MLRKYLCIHRSPKYAFTIILVVVIVSFAFTLFYNTRYGRAWNRSSADFVQRQHNLGLQTWRIDDGHNVEREVLRYDSGKESQQKDTQRNFGTKTRKVFEDERLWWDHESPEISTINEDHTFYDRRNWKGDDFLYKSGKQQAEKVVNLLNKVKPLRPSHRDLIGHKQLAYYMDILYDAILKETQKAISPFKSEPSCVGRTREEVEDLICIPKPKYLSELKNPCWFDETENRNLRCLPYFHILGCAKAGTTDLWNRLMAHPHIISNDGLLHKEALWWAWRRFGIYGYKRGVPMTFNNYTDQFQDTARLIQSSLKRNNHYHKVLITGDASPPDFWDFRGWRNISQNRGLDLPQVLTPHLMHHFYQNPKFILMFKDPIDRLYSDYFFVGGGLTSEDFHRDIVESIVRLAKCVRDHGIMRCFANNTLYYQLPVRLPFACYSVFMKEWLQVFPIERFLFIKTEDYQIDPEGTLKTVMDFLDLHPLKDSKLHEIADEEKSRITMQKKVAGEMKPFTKAILSKLLKPCNEHLARLIKQPKFVWNS